MCSCTSAMSKTRDVLPIGFTTLFYGCSKVLMTNHGVNLTTGWRSELSYPSPWPCESGLTITGHFLPARRPIWSSNQFTFCFSFFFRWMLPCQYFLDNWTLLSFTLLGVYIDQSSSSQIHQNVIWDKIHQTCEMRQDSPKTWSIHSAHDTHARTHALHVQVCACLSS